MTKVRQRNQYKDESEGQHQFFNMQQDQQTSPKCWRGIINETEDEGFTQGGVIWFIFYYFSILHCYQGFFSEIGNVINIDVLNRKCSQACVRWRPWPIYHVRVCVCVCVCKLTLPPKAWASEVVCLPKSSFLDLLVHTFPSWSLSSFCFFLPVNLS